MSADVDQSEKQSDLTENETEIAANISQENEEISKSPDDTVKCLSEEEKIIVCPLCEKMLSKPKCLPCVHSFCESCIGSYILEHANEENKTDSSFQCPVCRTIIVMPDLSIESWISLLPTNRLLINLAEKISLEKATQCDPCQRGNEETEATSWCKDCGEALCKQCRTYHQRMKLLMDHTVVDLQGIKLQPMKTADTEDICQHHGGKLIEAFCYDHDRLCCVECVTDNHRKCFKVVPLDDVSRDIKGRNEIADLSKRLTNVDDQAMMVITSRNLNIDNLSRRQEDILAEIASLKQEINKHLDLIEEKIKEEFSLMHKALVEELNIQSKNFECLHKSVSNGLNILKISAAHGTDQLIFTTAHKLKKLCEEHEWYIKSESGKIYHLEYDLDIENTLQTLTQNIPSVARISVKKSAANLVSSFMRDMHAVKIGDLNGKCMSDQGRCWITGGIFLPNGCILLADYSNRKLKCFNVGNELVFEQELEGKPWDATLVEEGHVVVSMPEESKLAFIVLDIDGNIANCETVDAKRGCHGITFAQNNLVAACSNQIRFMTKDGTLESSIDIGERGTRHIHTDKDSRLIYSTKGSVNCMSMEGEDYFIYSYKELRSPRGVASDKEGNFYVCGMDSNNVHQLCPDGSLNKILLNAKDGIHNPYAVVFEPESTRFLITQMDCDTVMLYKLVTKW